MLKPSEFAEFESLQKAVDSGAEASSTTALISVAKRSRNYRAYCWTYIKGHAETGEIPGVGTRPPSSVPGFLSLGRYYLAGLCALVGIGGCVAGYPFPGIAIGISGLAGVVASQIYANHKRWKQLESGACLRCAYDLRALPRAIDQMIAGMDFGPLKCPECGREWPLIPKRDGSA